MVPGTAPITPNPLDHFVSVVRWINEVAFTTPRIPKTSATRLAANLQRLAMADVLCSLTTSSRSRGGKDGSTWSWGAASSLCSYIVRCFDSSFGIWSCNDVFITYPWLFPADGLVWAFSCVFKQNATWRFGLMWWTVYAGVVRPTVRHKVRQSYFSRTVWPEITEFYKHPYWSGDRAYLHTRYDVTNCFMSEVIDDWKMAENDTSDGFKMESPNFAHTSIPTYWTAIQGRPVMALATSSWQLSKLKKRSKNTAADGFGLNFLRTVWAMITKFYRRIGDDRLHKPAGYGITSCFHSAAKCN